MIVLQLLGTLAIGSLITLIVKWRMDRGERQRSERRVLYLELLGLMNSQRRALERLSWEHDGELPPPVPDERLDEFNARLIIDSSLEVRALAATCFRTRLKFFNSFAMGAPIAEDEHGFFHYEFDNVAGKPNEHKELIMRMTLGGLSEQFGREVDALSGRIRRELHGKSD